MGKFKVFLIGVTATSLIAMANPLMADEDSKYPRLDIDVSVEVEYDGQVDGDVSSDDYTNDVFTTTEPFLSFKPAEGFALESQLVLEPVQDIEPGDDRIFDDHGFYAETLYLTYETNEFSVFGGKINPTFGSAFDLAPGIFGSGPAEDFYEQTEKIGLGGSFTFGGESGFGGPDIGTHTLTAQTFFVDTTFLNESVFTKRETVDKEDGGAGNTESLESFSVTLDGSDIPNIPVAYNLGIISSAKGDTETDREWGFVAGLISSFAVTEEVSIEPFIEYVHFDNDDGIDRDQDIITVAGTALYQSWNLALSYTKVSSDPGAGIEDNDLDSFQISAGYEFDIGLTADIGYNWVSEDDGTGEVDSDFIGVLLAYEFGTTIQ